jgi:hypothetical protein
MKMKRSKLIPPGVDPAAFTDEDRRVRRLARTVDLGIFYIKTGPVSRNQAEKLVERIRIRAGEWFPDKEDAFDLIYLPRLRRAITERFGLH